MSEKQVNILIVDDDAALISAMKLVLVNEGYNVETVTDSSSALDLVKQKSFDILLLDYNLPDMNGLDLMQQALEISSNSVPVLITGVSSMDLAFDGMRMGAHDYLVKPVDYDELKKIIKNILEERKKFEVGKERLQEIVGNDSKEINEKGDNVSLETVKTDGVDIEKKDSKKEFSEIRKILSNDEEKDDAYGSKEEEIKESTLKSILPLTSGEEYDDDEIHASSVDEKDKTIFDFVLDRSSRIRKKVINFIIFIIIFVLLSLAVDTLFFQFTIVGKNINNKIWPPDIILDSAPSGALVLLKDMNGVEIIEGNSYTPVTISKIPPGNYSLKMDIGKYNTVEQKITVFSSGEKIKDIAITGSAIKVFGKEKTQKFIIPFEIKVKIESEPDDAIVYIDGKRIGVNTPVTVDLTADKHTVMLEKDGFTSLGNLESYETYGQCNFDLSNQESGGIDIRYWETGELEKGIFLKGTFWKEIKINSEPSGAQIFVDEELVGLTPAYIRLKVGEHNLKIKKAGFTQLNETFKIPEKNEIAARLSRIVQLSAYNEDNISKDIGAKVFVNGREIRNKRTPFYHSFTQAKHKITFIKSAGFVKWTKYVKIKNQNKIAANMQRKKYPVVIKILKTVQEEEINDSEDNIKHAQGQGPADAAMIFVDGSKIGETDNNGNLQVSLKRGMHRIKVQKDNFKEKVLTKEFLAETKEIEIILEPAEGSPYREQAQERFEDIKQQTVNLIIDTRPNFPGASIFFDGKYEGETIRRIAGVPLGTHKITIKHPYIGKVTGKIELDKPVDKVIVNFNDVGEVELK